MKRSLFLVVAGTALVLASASYAKPDVRADIEANVDARDLAGADRTCVVEAAVKAYPNVPLTLVGPPLSGAARKLHEENIRKIKAALAVTAGLKACAPATAQGNEADAQP